MSEPPANTMLSIHLFVSGKVQGVFFRKFTKRAAKQLGLVGWVRNLSDGRVEVVAEGTKPQLEALRQWCETKGSPHSRVEDVVFDYGPATGGFLSFDVVH